MMDIHVHVDLKDTDGVLTMSNGCTTFLLAAAIRVSLEVQNLCLYIRDTQTDRQTDRQVINKDGHTDSYMVSEVSLTLLLYVHVLVRQKACHYTCRQTNITTYMCIPLWDQNRISPEGSPGGCIFLAVPV